MPGAVLVLGRPAASKEQKGTVLLANAVTEKHMTQYDFLVDKFDLVVEVKRGFPPPKKNDD